MLAEKLYAVDGGQEVDASGGDATETQLILTAPSNRITVIKRIRVSQGDHVSSEQYRLVVQRCDADGSGGSNPTPRPLQENQGSAGTTVRAGAMSEPTYTSGAELVDVYWNSLVGRDLVFQDEELVISPAEIVGIFVFAPSGSNAFTPNTEVIFGEIG